MIGASAIKADRIVTYPSDNDTKLEVVIEKYDPSGAGLWDGVGPTGKNIALNKNSTVARSVSSVAITASALRDLSFSVE